MTNKLCSFCYGLHISRLEDAVELHKKLKRRHHDLVILTSRGEIKIYAEHADRSQGPGGASFTLPEGNLRQTLIHQTKEEITRLEDELRGLGVNPGTPETKEAAR